MRKGYLVRLRQGLYTFPEYRGKPEFAAYFAGKIYNPSYISLHKALLDLLYLYPFYNTEQALADLRLDGEVLRADLNRAEWGALMARFHCAALEKRARLLSKVYGV